MSHRKKHGSKLTGAILIFILFFSLLVLGNMAYNDIRTTRFTEQLFDYPLPPETEIVDRAISISPSYARRIFVYEVWMVLVTSLNRDQIEEYYKGVRFPRLRKIRWMPEEYQYVDIELDFADGPDADGQLEYAISVHEPFFDAGFDPRYQDFIVRRGYVLAFLITSGLLANILWLLLSLRYQRRRAAVGAVAVAFSSAVVSLAFTICLDNTGYMEALRGGSWPSVTAAPHLAGIIDFFGPTFCFGGTFWVAAILTIALLENYRRNIGTHPDREDDRLLSSNGVGESGEAEA